MLIFSEFSGWRVKQSSLGRFTPCDGRDYNLLLRQSIFKPVEETTYSKVQGISFCFRVVKSVGKCDRDSYFVVATGLCTRNAALGEYGT